VVVVIQAGLSQPFGLTGPQHSEGGASFQAECLHASDDGKDRLQVPVFRPAPRGTHAKSRRALRLRSGGCFDDGLCIEHRLVLDAGRIAPGLRTVRAILRATAGFHREQRGKLQLRGVEMPPVNGLGLVNEFGKGQLE
jgi:hypothetical protein